MEEILESKINRSDYKILIVDDVVSNVLLLKILLTNEKFQVCTANCGNACIEQAKAEKPDKERHSVPKDKLLKEGFKFDYMTNIYRTKMDKVYYYCYDYGYYVDNDFVVIVQKKEYVD